MTREKLEAYRSKRAEIDELCGLLKDGGQDNAAMAGRQKIMVGRLLKECQEVEQWVEAIPDSLTRRIFRMYYLHGMTHRQIGRAVCMSQSTVSRHISKVIGP